jgi:DNA-binding response OmpR family regulator
MKLPFDLSLHPQGKQATIRHFLIVDDDEGVCKFLSAFLQYQGCECASCSDHAGVMEWLVSNPCEAVVLDLNLGHSSEEGFDLLKEIRVAFPKLPIVILTGSGYDENKLQTAIRFGANGYISKTIPPNELFAALMRALQPHVQG